MVDYFWRQWLLLEYHSSKKCLAQTTETTTVELHVSGLIGTTRHSGMQKIRKKNLFFFANRLHFLFLFGATAPPVGHGLIIHEVSRSHITTQHTRCDSSGRVISSSQRPLCVNTNNTHNRQTSMTPVGFKPIISAGERPQTYPIDRTATGTSKYRLHWQSEIRPLLFVLCSCVSPLRPRLIWSSRSRNTVLYLIR